MIFRMFASPVFFIFPLIIFFVVARVAVGFIRGITRRSYRDLPDDVDLYPEAYRENPQRAIQGKKSDEARIFRLALRLKGRLTVSDVVIEIGLNLQQAEDLLESLVDSIHVRMEVDDRGLVTYEFPEIIRRFEGGESGAV
ncbi:MAG: hypothetical protein KAU31_05185 [Spirochaetaceae bacterium]|nr:hypothetical protein [Spirochaetaceae bacterium]